MTSHCGPTSLITIVRYAKGVPRRLHRDYLAVEQLLITAVIFTWTAELPGVPGDGAIVMINNPSKPQLSINKACQPIAKLADLTIED